MINSCYRNVAGEQSNILGFIKDLTSMNYKQSGGINTGQTMTDWQNRQNHDAVL